MREQAILRSSFLDVTSGVPQGSIVGPLIFLLYVKTSLTLQDIAKCPCLPSHRKCCRVIEKTLGNTELLQSDLHSLCNWSTVSYLNFNVKKYTGIRFSSKRTKKSPDYNLNHQQINITSTQKDLAIIVTNDLKWTPHICCIVSKGSQMLASLRRNCTSLTDVKCRRLLYMTLVRAHLCYGSEIWARR